MSGKFVAICFCIISVLIIFIMPVLADGLGTAESPFLVGTYADFVSAVNNGGYIRLTADIPLAAKFNFPAVSVTIDGQGMYSLVANASTWATGSNTKHLIGINTGDATVTLKDLTLDCGKIAQGINVYQATDVTLDNVTIANCSTKALAVLTVNASDVKVENGLDIPDKLTIAIDVGKGKGLADPSFSLKGDCTINGMVWSTLSDADITLFAGTYNRQPDAKYIAEGYYAKDNGNNTWTILPRTYTVFFVANGGGAVKEATVAHGEKLALPEAPVRAGYEFAGWYTDAGLTEPFDENTVMTEGFTLYANWTELSDIPGNDEEGASDSETTQPPELPVTGDRATPVMWAGIMVAACAAAFVMIKRRRAA